MGAKGSSLSSPADGRCEWCGFGTEDPKPAASLDYSTCRRCSGIVGRRKAPASSGGGSSSRRAGGGHGSSSAAARLMGGEDEKSAVGAGGPGGELSAVQLELKVVHLLPFSETLPHSDTAPTESSLLAQYVAPYFASRRGLYLTAGVRLQINEVDFKVASCFPPAGLVSERTQLRCMGQPLHALTELRKLHVLPAAATLTQPLTSSTLFYEYLKPFFNDPTAAAAPAALSSSSASSSASSSSTTSSSSKASSPLPPPAAAASSSSSAAAGAPAPAASGGSVSSGQHHLSVGDTFLSRGVQFKVVACEPSDGVVTAKCDIFPDGNPIADVSRVHVLPIYESLPNSEKNINAEQLLRRYLQPYFLGRFQLVSKNDQLDIDGVTFRVQACEPDKGVVTSATEIFAEGEPLRADDIRRQQEVEDEQMARRLQQQEAQENGLSLHRPLYGLPSGPGIGMGMGMGMGLHGLPIQSMGVPGLRRPAAAPSFSSTDELRARMQQLYAQLPAEHHGRTFIASLIQTLGEAQGANRRDIEALPTREYHARPAAPATAAAAAATEEKDRGGAESKQAEENRESIQCMVCLCEYESGDILRTLPCLTGDHRVLTSRGWKSITKIKVGDDVLSLNLTANATGQYVTEWKPVTNTVRHVLDPHNPDDQLFRMQGMYMDVIATRNHRMLVAAVTSSTGLQQPDPIRFETVEQLATLTARVSRLSSRTKFSEVWSRNVVCGGLNDQPGVKIVIPNMQRVCDWWWDRDRQAGFLKFLGFWLGDGYLGTQNGHVIIGQKKVEFTAWLIQLLHVVFPGWWCRNFDSDDAEGVIYKYKYLIRCPPLYEYLRQMSVGPIGYNPRDPSQLRSYPHFTPDSQLAALEQQSDHCKQRGMGRWTEEAMLAAMKGEAEAEAEAGAEAEEQEDEAAAQDDAEGAPLVDVVRVEDEDGTVEEVELPAIEAFKTEEDVKVAGQRGKLRIFNGGLWVVISGHWFYLKRWMGDEEQIANVYSRLSREQAVALLDGFCRADGDWLRVQYADDGTPTGQWRCSGSSFPLMDHLMLIAQLAGAAVHIEKLKSAGESSTVDGRQLTCTVDHWRLFFHFSPSTMANNPASMRLSALAEPVDVSRSIAARGYYRFEDDTASQTTVHCITVADNGNFLTQRLSITRKASEDHPTGVTAHCLFIGNCFHSYHQGCIDEWLNRSKLCPLCKHPISVDS